MIAIKNTAGQQKLTPNLLPCAIRHDGPVPVDQRYWSPVQDEGKQTVYFRGRKLQGASVKVPHGYQGVLLQKTDERLIAKPGVDVEEEQVQMPETRICSQQAQFDEVVVWGHELEPDADDAYVKGVQEWIAFAETASVLYLVLGPSLTRADAFDRRCQDLRQA